MNKGYIYRETIRDRTDGQRLDGYLSAAYPHSSEEQWADRIADGELVLDGTPAGSDALLHTGQRLEWHRPPWSEPAAPLDLRVLRDDGGVLVVAKPAGLPTLPGGGCLANTLLHQLRLRSPDASPMHRRDRWTSGAILCSRARASGASLAAQFVARTIHKRYRALASGRPAQPRFGVDVSIGPVPYPPLGSVQAARPDGRPASSQVAVLEHRPGSFLCDVTIFTGRPHQIRIHLAAAGHPLVGDPLYVAGGGPNPDGTALPGDPGYHLHAAELGYEDPGTGLRVIVNAPIPEVLQVGFL